MIALQIAPFVLVALLAGVAVLSHCFDDNLLQRIGLSAASIGAALVAWVLARGCPASMHAAVLLAYGVAIYACGTAWKVRQFFRHTSLSFPPIAFPKANNHER